MNLRSGGLWTGIGLLVCVLWLFHPMLAESAGIVLGDPRTDAIRGAWGFDHLGTSVLGGQSPWSTDRLNFPAGVQLMVLPLASGLMLMPLSVLEPMTAWNISVMLLVFCSALSLAWLTQVLSGNWAAGFLAGVMLLSQPMIHHAIADGTAEHIALWGIPMFIGAAWLALAEQSPKWGIMAGLLSIVVALDSPYHGLYALVIGIMVLPFAIRFVRGREADLARAVGAMVVASMLGIAIVVQLYAVFENGSTQTQDAAILQHSNATDMRLWWHHLSLANNIRDPTRPPTIIPTAILSGAMLLCLVGGRRSLPWLVSGTLMLGLSFGLRIETIQHLSAWLGMPGELMGEMAIGFNDWFYKLPIAEQLRFPRRWLVPSSMALSVGAGIGLNFLFQTRLRSALAQAAVVAVLGATSLTVGIGSSRIHKQFPMHTLPEVEFAEALKNAEGPGAILFLPAVRELEPGATRDSLPVFANLGSELASADDLYLQLLHGRPMVSYPSLQTLTAHTQSKDVNRLLRDWSDLSDGKSSGRGIPPSAFDPGAKNERFRGFKELREAGLRWVAVDLNAYDDEGLALLRKQIGNKIAKETQFDEGDGVLLLELRPASVLLAPDEPEAEHAQ
jgi:hypothetical protein